MRQDDILASHGMEAYGRDPVDADDLVRLAGAWPELTPVFEELQHLRNENEGLREKNHQLVLDRCPLCG